LSAYYRDHDKVAVDARLRAYNSAMEQMTQRYPDDYEAHVFYALTLQASASPDDTTYANQLKSAAILEKLHEMNPQHPGVSHFLIHAYDYPPLADRGLAAARRYAGIAPAVPHARHMPSHIYSMVGLWEESIASNASALEIQPTTTTRPTSWFTRTSSSRRMQRLGRLSRNRSPRRNAAIVHARSATSRRMPPCRRATCSSAGIGPELPR